MRYYCSKCKKHHTTTSNIGKGHTRFKPGRRPTTNRRKNPPRIRIIKGKASIWYGSGYTQEQYKKLKTNNPYLKLFKYNDTVYMNVDEEYVKGLITDDMGVDNIYEVLRRSWIDKHAYRGENPPNHPAKLTYTKTCRYCGSKNTQRQRGIQYGNKDTFCLDCGSRFNPILSINPIVPDRAGGSGPRRHVEPMQHRSFPEEEIRSHITPDEWENMRRRMTGNPKKN